MKKGHRITSKPQAIFRYYSAFHDGIKSEFSQEVFDREFEEYKLVYKEFFPQDKKAKILDIGCGTGDFLYFIKKLGYKDFFGVDASRENVEFIKKYITTKVMIADGFEYLNNKKNYYDLVIMNNLLEHIPKDLIASSIQKVFHSLKSKGIFICKVPNMENPFTSYTRWIDFTHTIGFTQNSLKMVVRMGGFRNVKIFPYEKRKKTLKTILKKIVQSFIRPFIHVFFECPKRNYFFHKFIVAVGVKEQSITWKKERIR